MEEAIRPHRRRRQSHLRRRHRLVLDRTHMGWYRV